MTVELTSTDSSGITVATITLGHAPLNVLDLEHCRDLVSCLTEVHADDRARVVVIRGSGKAFSAGVDIAGHTREHFPTLLPAFHEVFERLLKVRAFTVAAVHGHCLGGAAELAFACDRVVSTRDAKIGLPEITLGCYPPVGIPLFMAKLPHGTAVRMMISGDNIDVADLERFGLVDRITEPDALDAGIEAEVALFAGKSPAILGMLADLVHEQTRRQWADRIPAMEEHYLDRLLSHPDVDEGIRAFLEKRPPVWQDPEERPDPLESLI